MANSFESYSGQTGDISIYRFGDPVDDDQCFRPLDRYLRSNQELPQDFDWAPGMPIDSWPQEFLRTLQFIQLRTEGQGGARAGSSDIDEEQIAPDTIFEKIPYSGTEMPLDSDTTMNDLQNRFRSLHIQTGLSGNWRLGVLLGILEFLVLWFLKNFLRHDFWKNSIGHDFWKISCSDSAAHWDSKQLALLHELTFMNLSSSTF